MVALPIDDDARHEGGEAPRVWVLHDGKPGMASQALGLAEATGLPFREIALSVRRPWRWMPPALWVAPLAVASGADGSLSPPWPDLVIGCGRNAVRPALAIRRASGGRTLAAHIQDPRYGRGEFDLLLVPAHDRLRAAHAVVTQGALHRVTPARLLAERRRFPALEALPRPILGVLIGGPNRVYRLDPATLGRIADRVAAAVRRSGGSAVVTASRRTGRAGMALLRRQLADVPGVLWDGTGDNPYFAYLAVADALLVTADSVSMVSEAAATGKPVHVIDLAGGDAKFARFHETMRRLGATRPFAGDIEHWSYTPPDDNARAADALRQLLATHLAPRRAV